MCSRFRPYSLLSDVFLPAELLPIRVDRTGGSQRGKTSSRWDKSNKFQTAVPIEISLISVDHSVRFRWRVGTAIGELRTNLFFPRTNSRPLLLLCQFTRNFSSITDNGNNFHGTLTVIRTPTELDASCFNPPSEWSTSLVRPHSSWTSDNPINIAQITNRYPNPACRL